MRTTVTLDDDVLDEAIELTGVKERTRLLQQALEALISREKARRLSALGGTENALKPIPRRRGK